MRNHWRILWAGLCLVLLSAGPAGGQVGRRESATPPESARRVLTAARIDGAPPVIDGALDDPVWQTADVATGFVQYTPASGRPATEETEARVAFDDDAIYIAMRMYDAAPDSIGMQLSRRDASGIYSDWAHVVIDSYNDRRTGFRFSLSPRGIQKDVLHYDDLEEDLGWNAVWEAAARVDSLGWTAEFRIPLSQLRFSASDAGDAAWGINFGREVARRDERSYWSPVLQDVVGYVSRSGELHGVPALAAPRRLEVMPYSLARATRAPGTSGDPFHEPTEVFGTIGADLKFGVTSNLTLTATFNPDFGQVEADPSQVNLTAFETFYAERRPFFLEGSDIFRFRLAFGDGDGANEQLFYSRRIGRPAQGSVPDEAVHADVPQAATILGAAKLSGKTAGGWSVGILNAVTSEETAAYVDESGIRGRTTVEPLTNYAVARVMKDFRDGGSRIGGLVTATHRRLDDELDFLRSAAYAGAIDFKHRFHGGDYQITAALLGSHIQGSAEAIDRAQRAAGRYFQRPDADHLTYDPARTSLSGTGAMLEIGKFGGGSWRWAVGGTARSPGFDVNDIGYQRNADAIDQFVWVGYRNFQPGRIVRNWNLNFNQWTGWTFGRERVSTGGNVNGYVQFINHWGANAGIGRNHSSLSTSALRGGPAIVRPSQTNYWFGLHSDRRKTLALNLNGSGYVEEESGTSSFWIGPELRWRASSGLELSLQPGMTWTDGAWQYVAAKEAAGSTHYIFAGLDQRTASLTARVDYTVTPRLSFQFYAQPFISAGRYSGFREVTDPRAGRFADRFHRYGADQLHPAVNDSGDRIYQVDLDADGTPDFTFDDPDFNFKELRSNAVLRWEYRPGSTLFLVWSQGRSDVEPQGAYDLGRDGKRLFETRGTNILMLKVSYWLDI